MILLSVGVLLFSIFLLLLAQADFGSLMAGHYNSRDFAVNRMILFAMNFNTLLFVSALLGWKTAIT